MQSFSEKFKNFWYHYKFHSILGSLLLVLIILSISLFPSNEKYDYQVILYTSENVPGFVESSFELALEKYGQDIDENDEINVNVINLSYNPTQNDSFAVSQATTLIAQLQIWETFIFITDDFRFNELDKKIIFEQHDFFGHFDNKALKLSELSAKEEVIDILKSRDAKPFIIDDFVDSLYLLIRQKPADNTDKYLSNYNNSLDFLHTINRGGN